MLLYKYFKVFLSLNEKRKEERFKAFVASSGTAVFDSEVSKLL